MPRVLLWGQHPQEFDRRRGNVRMLATPIDLLPVHHPRQPPPAWTRSRPAIAGSSCIGGRFDRHRRRLGRRGGSVSPDARNGTNPKKPRPRGAMRQPCRPNAHQEGTACGCSPAKHLGLIGEGKEEKPRQARRRRAGRLQARSLRGVRLGLHMKVFARMVDFPWRDVSILNLLRRLQAAAHLLQRGGLDLRTRSAKCRIPGPAHAAWRRRRPAASAPARYGGNGDPGPSSASSRAVLCSWSMALRSRTRVGSWRPSSDR